MRFRAATPALIAAALCLAAGCTRDAAARDVPHAVTVLHVSTSPDSLKYVLRWTASTDALGSADSYKLQVSSSKATGFLVSRTITGTVDSFTVAKPAPGDSVTFTAQVAAIRRGLVSAFAVVSWKYRRPDAPPPPPAITVDSSQIAMLFVRPQVVTLAVGDTAQVCALGVRRDSTTRIVVPKGVTSADSAGYVSACRPVYTAWLSERAV